MTMYKHIPSLKSSIANAFIPFTCRIPVHSSHKKDLDIIVKKGDEVQEGSIIAYDNSSDSRSFHSSIPGKIREISNVFSSEKEYSKQVVVDLKGDFSLQRSKTKIHTWESLSADKLFSQLNSMGVTAVYDLPDRTKEPNHLLVPAFSTEPYLQTDAMILSKWTEEVLEAIRICSHMYPIAQVSIILDPRERNLYRRIKKHISSFQNWRVVHPPRSRKGSFYDASTLSFLFRGYSASTSHAVISSAVLRAIYDAVVLRRPLIETIIAVCGEPVRRPSFICARIGSPLLSLFSECGGFSQIPSHVVVGSLLTGHTITSFEQPLSADMHTIFALYKKEEQESQQPCIHCGLCVQNCPVDLEPQLLFQLISQGKNDEAKKEGLEQCINCGLCAQVCPSRIPLTALFADSKKHKFHARLSP